MARPDPSANIDNLAVVEAYVGGASENAIAKSVGVSRLLITRVLNNHGVPRRGVAEANRLEQVRRTPEQRAAYTEAAHAATRGRERSFDEACRMALGRQRNLSYVSDEEITLRRWLAERDVPVIPQLAIGPYNCDLAARPVAVEVFGGNWHGSGAHRANFAQRTRYLFDQGWALVLVWATREWPLAEPVADYLAAFYKQASRNPPSVGEYRVVGGGGQDFTVAGLDLDQLSRVPARDRGTRPRA